MMVPSMDCARCQSVGALVSKRWNYCDCIWHFLICSSVEEINTPPVAAHSLSVCLGCLFFLFWGVSGVYSIGAIEGFWEAVGVDIQPFLFLVTNFCKLCCLIISFANFVFANFMCEIYALSVLMTRASG